MTLTDTERAAKERARDEVYGELIGQLGSKLVSSCRDQLATEEVMPARPLPIELPGDVALRYEWRGEALRAQGAIDDVITYAGHWQPAVDALLARA